MSTTSSGRVDLRTLSGQQMCALKDPGEIMKDRNRFKVTARYTLQLTEKRRVKCVRVSHYEGNANMVWHLSEAEFARLFRKLVPR